MGSSSHLPKREQRLDYTLILEADTPMGRACQRFYEAQGTALLLTDSTWWNRSQDMLFASRLGKEARIEFSAPRGSCQALSVGLDAIHKRYGETPSPWELNWRITRIIWALGRKLPERVHEDGIEMGEFIDRGIEIPYSILTTVCQHMCLHGHNCEAIIARAELFQNDRAQNGFTPTSGSAYLDQFPWVVEMAARAGMVEYMVNFSRLRCGYQITVNDMIIPPQMIGVPPPALNGKTLSTSPLITLESALRTIKSSGLPDFPALNATDGKAKIPVIRRIFRIQPL